MVFAEYPLTQRSAYKWHYKWRSVDESVKFASESQTPTALYEVDLKNAIEKCSFKTYSDVAIKLPLSNENIYVHKHKLEKM